MSHELVERYDQLFLNTIQWIDRGVPDS